MLGTGPASLYDTRAPGAECSGEGEQWQQPEICWACLPWPGTTASQAGARVMGPVSVPCAHGGASLWSTSGSGQEGAASSQPHSLGT